MEQERNRSSAVKRLYFIVEGETEESFVKEILAPYFMELGIFDVRAFRITKKGSKGGFVNYQHLKNDIERLLVQEKDVIITSFIDFFRIPTTVPGYQETVKLQRVSDRIQRLEQGMANDINNPRFIPYIQQHEFEALLFSAPDGFNALFEDKGIDQQIEAIIQAYPNPEDINDRPQTAPSKRLLRIIPDYNKVLDGNLVAAEIGLEAILEKCPRFSKWIDQLGVACRT